MGSQKGRKRTEGPHCPSRRRKLGALIPKRLHPPWHRRHPNPQRVSLGVLHQGHPSKTPFDWVLTLQGHTILADTKTCNHNTFPHSNIDPHQVRKLVRHDTAPTKAGYLIWLRKPDVVLYAPSTHLFAIMDTRGGIAPDDPNIKNLGSFSDMALRSLFI